MRLRTKGGKQVEFACSGIPLGVVPKLMRMLEKALDESGYESMIVDFNITMSTEKLPPLPPSSDGIAVGVDREAP